MKINKFCVFMFIFLLLALSSCSSSDQKVTIKNVCKKIDSKIISKAIDGSTVKLEAKLTQQKKNAQTIPTNCVWRIKGNSESDLKEVSLYITKYRTKDAKQSFADIIDILRDRAKKVNIKGADMAVFVKETKQSGYFLSYTKNVLFRLNLKSNTVDARGGVEEILNLAQGI